MKKIRITVPATTANLGPGFDCLGVALNLFNTFEFEENSQFELINFDAKYANDNNLVVKSAKYAYSHKRQPVIPFKVTLYENVPNCRGLGSSATCVIAGILAANFFMDSILTPKDIIRLASDMEGHPDNVAPALYGSLVASVKGKDIICVKSEIANNLSFIAAIPNFTLATKEARSVLPKKMGYSKVVYNMSRAINIPYALKSGDCQMLFSLLDDKMHEPYRLPIIDEAYKFKSLSIKCHIPFCISGSGSTLLFITDDVDVLLSEIKQLNLTNQWEIKVLKPVADGTSVEEISE